jgi:hypothetical protein
MARHKRQKTRNLTGAATYKQRTALYFMTGVKWVGIDVDKGAASGIIGQISLYFRGKIEASKLEEAIRAYHPDWNISQVREPKGLRGQEQAEGSEGESKGEVSGEVAEKETNSADSEDEANETKGLNEVEEAIEQLRKALEREAAEKIKGSATGGPIKLDPSAGAYIKPPIWDEVISLVGAGLNVMVPGPAGCGKSRMFSEIAKTLELEFFTISFSGGLRYAQTIGSTHINDGKSEWRPTPLLEAVQKPGIVFLDEIWSADPEVSLALNSLLEPDSRSIQTPVGRIEVHEGCRFVAAANTVGRSLSRQYTGAQRADDSLLDRFMIIPMTYDIRVEEAILGKMGVNGEAGKYLIESLQALRARISESNTPFDASTRRLINAAKAYLAGLPHNRAFEIAFLNGLSKTERSKLSC